MSWFQVTSENDTVMITEIQTKEIQVAVVETDEDDKPEHGEERYNEVPEKALPPSTHRVEALADSEGLKRKSDSARDNTVDEVDSDLNEKVVAGTEGEEPDHGEEHEKETNKETEAGPKTGHVVAQSVQDTVTIAETDTTEAQV